MFRAGDIPGRGEDVVALADPLPVVAVRTGVHTTIIETSCAHNVYCRFKQETYFSSLLKKQDLLYGQEVLTPFSNVVSYYITFLKTSWTDSA